VRRAIVIALSVILVLVVAAPTVLAQAGAPQDVDETPITIPAGSFANCAFDVEAQFSGKGKQINLPDGSFIATSPGLSVTLTNLDNPENQETFSITGSFDVTTDPETGDVTTVSRGRSLLGDPVAGLVIATGNYSFVVDEDGNLLEPLSGEGQTIDVCEALA
jgi:outer membrane lipoprotein-sorting protein